MAERQHRALPLITDSAQRTFRRCPREYRYAYEQRYRARLSAGDALRFGSLIHTGLESYWLVLAKRDAEGTTPLSAACAAMLPHAADEYELARAETLMLGYDSRWASDNDDLDVLGVEVEFATELVNPSTGAPSRTFRLGGKIDAIVRRRSTGVDYIVEHKCLVGSSRIFDHSTGRYWSIAELAAARRAPLVTAMTEDKRTLVTSARPPVAVGARPVVRVRTGEGRVLGASENHPFYTRRGWVPASELRAGEDWIATPRRQGSTCTGIDVPDEALRLAGYMIGDGSMSNMSFCKHDENVLTDVIACARRLGETPHRYTSSKQVPVLKFSTVGPVAAMLKRLGVTGNAADKRVPQVPMSDAQCCHVLAGLWSTDGCVDCFEGDKPRIIYTSVSERLCRDVQELLQRIGIASSFNATSVPYKGARRPVFTIKVVSRGSKRRFASLVQERVIPLTRSAVTMERLVACIPAGDFAREQPQIDKHVWWDRVAELTSGPPENLYDIEVPGAHTFVSEGLITHNTTTADIGPGSAYWERLQIDSQVSTYYAGARALGFDPQGVIYDVLTRPRHLPLEATPVDARTYRKDGTLYARQRADAETPEQFRARIAAAIVAEPHRYYQRGAVVRLATEEIDAGHDAWQTTQLIRDAQRTGRWPRNADACERYGRMCSYFAVCTGRAQLDDPALYEHNADAHVELSAAIQAV